MKIKEIIDFTDNQIDSDLLYEMANLSKTTTGIDPVIFCSQKGGSKHECKVKVSNILGKLSATDVFTIELKDSPVIGYCKLTANQLESAKWWIHKNRFAILDYWEEIIDTGEFLNRIIKL